MSSTQVEDMSSTQVEDMLRRHIYGIATQAIKILNNWYMLHVDQDRQRVHVVEDICLRDTVYRLLK